VIGVIFLHVFKINNTTHEPRTGGEGGGKGAELASSGSLKGRDYRFISNMNMCIFLFVYIYVGRVYERVV